MQIQLKQAEIVEALKQFISKQGISLSGKDVSIAFTAGRKEAGITADLVIEDADIPGFSESDEVEPQAQAKLTVVPSVAGIDTVPVIKSPTVAEEPPKEAVPVVEKQTSLFS